nr:helix-turn-helix domain-containing protein [Sporosarcina limicola]
MTICCTYITTKVVSNVKHLRISQEFDLTQEELAKALGVSRHTIISIENGGNTTGKMVMKIAEFFRKDPRANFL